MTKIRNSLILLVAAALLAVACGSDSGVSSSAQDDAPDGERVETLWVGAQLVDCVGAFPQTCMQVKYSADGQAEYFYDSIEGFDHVAGTSYVLKVGVRDVEDPPADASSLSYRLIEVVESSSEPAGPALEGTSWTLLGFRDGDLFDPVPEGVDATAIFDGANVSGSSGCNTYSGTFSADGDGVNVGPLITTRMACEPDRMDLEQRFLTTLETVDSVEITFDDRLMLKPPSGPALVFVAS